MSSIPVNRQISDVEAKAIVERIAPELGLSPAEQLAVRLVAKHETGYGGRWKGNGVGSNNWGADTTTSTTPGKFFEHGDTRYDPATGKVIAYETHFNRYPTPEDGARGVARFLLFKKQDPARGRLENVTAAIKAGSLLDLAAAMRANRYYLGTKPYAESIGDYHHALLRAYRDVQADTGEEHFGPKAQQPSQPSLPSSGSVSRYLLALSESLPVLREGARGDLVGVLQYELGGLAIDEHFGPKTRARLIAYRAERGITSDVTGRGVAVASDAVGVRTWRALFAVDGPDESGAAVADARPNPYAGIAPEELLAGVDERALPIDPKEGIG